MPDPITNLRSELHARLGEPPIQIASVLCSLGSCEQLAQLAADRGLTPTQRAIALLAVALVLTHAPDAAVPDAALDAVEDNDTATTAIAMGLGGALTAVLHAAPKASGLRATRMLIGRRLLAAGENGPHVIRLLLDGGDRDRAAQAAAADLLAHLDAGPAPELWARIHLVIDWSDDAEFFVAMLRELPQTALARLLELLDQAPGVEPARAQPARAAIGWALTAGSHDRSRR